MSIISSIKIAFLPFTSPIIFITSDTLAFALLLSIIASGVCNQFANPLALFTPPTSGDTTTVSSGLNPYFMKCFAKIGNASIWSTGISKNP